MININTAASATPSLCPQPTNDTDAPPAAEAPPPQPVCEVCRVIPTIDLDGNQIALDDADMLIDRDGNPIIRPVVIAYTQAGAPLGLTPFGEVLDDLPIPFLDAFGNEVFE